MNIENLQTPHPNHIKLDRPETPRPLLDVIDIDGLRAELADARERGDDYFAKTIKDRLPYGVLEPIRRSLRHVEGDGPNATTTPLDTLEENGETHCFGYALVTSYVLGQLGVKHWLAAIDKHATPIVPIRLRGNDNLYVADGMNLEYAHFIGQALRRTTIAVMRREMDDAKHPRGVALLDLGSLPRNYNVLRHKPSAVTPGEIIGESERLHPQLVVSSFYKPVGERVLQESARFHAAATHGDYQRAALALRQIPGLYYDISAQAPRDHIRDVVTGLCESGHFEVAEQAIDDYCQSFQRTKHAVFAELRADLLATVATAKGCINAYADAQAFYRLAASRTRLAHQAKRILDKAETLAVTFKPRPTVIGLQESR